jgi:thymidylate synthase
VKIAKNTPNSRQLLVLNTKNFSKTYQCFNLVQFLLNTHGVYEMHIYQRSHDLAKNEKDSLYFGYLAKLWEKMVGIEVRYIVLTYGNLHYEK